MTLSRALPALALCLAAALTSGCEKKITAVSAATSARMPERRAIIRYG